MSHNCPVSVCPKVVTDDSKYMCWGHWRLVPEALQRPVYIAYGRGRGAGTRKLADAQQAALTAVEQQLSTLTPQAT